MTNITTKEIIPTTIIGIKRLANTLKKEHSVSLSEALMMASKKAGYQNYKHAVRSLSAQTVIAASGLSKLTILAQWPSADGMFRKELKQSIAVKPWLIEELSQNAGVNKALPGFHFDAVKNTLTYDIHCLSGEILRSPDEFPDHILKLTLKRAVWVCLFMSETGLRYDSDMARHIQSDRPELAKFLSGALFWVCSETQQRVIMTETSEKITLTKTHLEHRLSLLNASQHKVIDVHLWDMATPTQPDVMSVIYQSFSSVLASSLSEVLITLANQTRTLLPILLFYRVDREPLMQPVVSEIPSDISVETPTERNIEMGRLIRSWRREEDLELIRGIWPEV